MRPRAKKFTISEGEARGLARVGEECGRGGGPNRPANVAFGLQPPGDTSLVLRDDGIALIFVAESPKWVTK